MAVKYKIVEKAQAGVKGGGKKKYCVALTGSQIVDLEKLGKKLDKVYNIKPSTLLQVVEALSYEIPNLLEDGYNIHLGNLGIFSLSVSSELKKKPDKLNKFAIKEVRLDFRPSTVMKQKVQRIRFVKLTK